MLRNKKELKRSTIYVDDLTRSTAKIIGDGNISEGFRILAAAARSSSDKEIKTKHEGIDQLFIEHKESR